MYDLLRERVRLRLETLELNPFEAARKASFERSFVNDLLIGKKTTVRQSKLPALARALDCDPEYLTGLQGSPRAGGPAGALKLAGIAEAGAWRQPGNTASQGQSIPLGTDPRYPAHEQEAFIVRGNHAAGIGVTDGAVVTVYTGQMAYRDGDVVAVRRKRSEGDVEITIRVRAKDRLAAKPGHGSPEVADLDTSEGEIIGLVLSAHRVFGPPT
jgi:hypothetical protein